jgi:hypothetical protein
MPLLEVVGKAANAAPEHIGATAVKVGVTGGVAPFATTTVFVAKQLYLFVMPTV